MTIGGAPLDPAASYRITTNNFLADGGDDFPSLRAGTNRTSLSDFDIDSLVRYLAADADAGRPPSPPATDRIDASTSHPRRRRKLLDRAAAALAPPPPGPGQSAARD